MNSTYVYGGILIAVVIAIGAYFYPQVGSNTFGTAVDCGSTTCFTTLGVLTSFQDDGTALFNGTVTLAGGVTLSGATTLASTTITQLKVGQAGTQATGLNFSTCQIVSTANTIAASSTKQVDCAGAAGAALGGITVGDKVIVQNSSSTPSTTGAGLTILGASASSTSGFLTLILYNGTGGTFTWTAGASSSYQYVALR